MNFGENLKNELKWQGITQVELEKTLRVSKNNITEWQKADVVQH